MFLSINSEYSSDDFMQLMLFSILACKSWHLGLAVLVHLKRFKKSFLMNFINYFLPVQILHHHLPSVSAILMNGLLMFQKSWQ